MDYQRIGGFICELRKEKKMTQKELAENLNITDKAVSKWERGLSCPDVALLPPLAELLGVSINELLSGARTEAPIPEAIPVQEVEKSVKDALFYSEKASRKNGEKILSYCFAGFTLFCLIGITVSLICDLSITRKLTWSLLVVSSTLYGWLILLPFFQAGKHKLRSCLLLITLLTVPYLLVLSGVLGEKLIVTMGTVIFLFSIVYVWLIYGLMKKWKARLWLAGAAAVLCALPVTIGTNLIIGNFTKETVDTLSLTVNTLSLLLLSFILCMVDYLGRQRTKYQ